MTCGKTYVLPGRKESSDMPSMEAVLSVFLCSLFLLCILAIAYFILAMRDYTKRSRMVRKLTKKLPSYRSDSK